jgi:hypothetical protein
MVPAVCKDCVFRLPPFLETAPRSMASDAPSATRQILTFAMNAADVASRTLSRPPAGKVGFGLNPVVAPSRINGS